MPGEYSSPVEPSSPEAQLPDSEQRFEPLTTKLSDQVESFLSIKDQLDSGSAEFRDGAKRATFEAKMGGDRVVMELGEDKYWGKEHGFFTFNGGMRGNFENWQEVTDDNQASTSIASQAIVGAGGEVTHAFFETDDGQTYLIRRSGDTLGEKSATKQGFELISTTQQEKGDGEVVVHPIASEQLKDVFARTGEPLVLGNDTETGKPLMTQGNITRISTMQRTEEGKVPPSHPILNKQEKVRDTPEQFIAAIDEARRPSATGEEVALEAEPLSEVQKEEFVSEGVRKTNEWVANEGIDEVPDILELESALLTSPALNEVGRGLIVINTENGRLMVEGSSDGNHRLEWFPNGRDASEGPERVTNLETLFRNHDAPGRIEMGQQWAGYEEFGEVISAGEYLYDSPEPNSNLSQQSIRESAPAINSQPAIESDAQSRQEAVLDAVQTTLESDGRDVETATEQFEGQVQSFVRGLRNRASREGRSLTEDEINQVKKLNETVQQLRLVASGVQARV